MKAILIDGPGRQLSEVNVNDAAEIAALVGQDSIITDDLGDGDAVHFDEDCFIRGTEGRFQIDSLAPIAGKAVVVGLSGEALADTGLDVDALQARIKFIEA